MENETFKEELDKMEIRLSDMEDKLDRLDEKLTQVVDALLGNPLTKQGGFIHDIDVIKLKIQELEKKQVKYDIFKNRVSWTIGIIVGAAVILQFISSVYANLKPNLTFLYEACRSIGKVLKKNITTNILNNKY